MLGLAAIYRDQGQWKKAEELKAKVVEIRSICATAIEIADELEGNVTTRSYYKSDQIFSHGNIPISGTGSLSMTGEEDTETVYSEVMTFAGSIKETYVTELAEQQLLFRPMNLVMTQLAVQRDIMVLVHKYRQDITEEFTSKYSNEGAAQQSESQHDGMSLDDIRSMWD
ncbi:hypothetical protein BDV23DRAFT_188990 [Aspergillus alliaceus]|uniref:Uncharacterized protein n=1 Tax=Petromyces alliaceus TaxID=209559 RepID=A0A5N7BSD3_PETAA|nr:hypothetical protein BDV23DRAFT_188990 [Aspergillus alliaceus]